MARILPGEDLLIRMQRDMRRSLAADISSIKWSMIVDLAKCAGCHACTIGCVAENKLPPGVVYRPVIEEEVGIYPYGARPVVIDGITIPGDARRGSGFHANAAIRVDSVLKNTTLCYTVGGSAVFYNSQVKLMKV